MNNISYFCIVKRFTSIYRPLLLAFSLLFIAVPRGWADEMDSVRISFLTCSPHEEIYSLYGHTALRYENPARGIDVAVNYGIFNFHKPHFVLRFVFGLTDYEMGITPFPLFCEEYRAYGSKVTQQVINLNADQKRRIVAALEENYLPQNRVYRYNYFYDNCTTRARDIVFSHLEDPRHQIIGKSYTQERTFRQMIHSCNEHHPWARFGNDILLGLQADRPTTNAEQEFLPANLMADLDEMLISDNKSYEAPMVIDKFTVVEPGVQTVESDFPLRPRTCAILLLALSALVFVLERIGRTLYWGFDLALMLLSGLAGIVLFLMLFSQHPTVRLNLQLLALNPLPLLFAYIVAKATRAHRPRHWWWPLWALLLVLFLAGSALQSYAEGMILVGLALLLRPLSHFVKREPLSRLPQGEKP